jgi:sugar lactone lactonase YvrE
MRAIAEGLRFPEGPVWMGDGSILPVEVERGTLSRADVVHYRIGVRNAENPRVALPGPPAQLLAGLIAGG